MISRRLTERIQKRRILAGRTRGRRRARIPSEDLIPPAMKRTIVHVVVALCVASLMRADQTVQSVQQALKDQAFYYGEVTGDQSTETTDADRRYQSRNRLQVSGK